MGHEVWLPPSIEVTAATIADRMAVLIGPPHSHPTEFEVHYFSGGRGSLFVGSSWYELEPDDLYLVRPGDVHASREQGHAGARRWHVRFTLREPVPLPISLENVHTVTRLAGEASLRETWRRLIDEYRHQQHGWEWLCSSLVNELIVGICRVQALPLAARHKLARTTPDTGALVRARGYAALHYFDRLTVPHLARIAYMSPSRFATAFRELFGRPPIDYLIETRIHHATQLLREGFHTVSQVAEMTGFDSVHYFSRQFRQRRGAPPSAYLPTKHPRRR